MPSKPKTPPRKGELPFDDADILKADDPRPQRVPQYPASGARRALKKVEEHIPTSVFDTEKHDEELRATYGSGDSQKPAFLYVERGPGAGQLLEVKQGVVVIGRASVSDLRIQHPSISRRHAQIKRVGEQFFVKDLSSQNGTFVNKQRLATEIEMKVGDSLALGNALVRLRGPMTKGEKLPPAPPSATPVFDKPQTKQLRQQTGLVARPSGGHTDVRKPKQNALKIAVFAGAVGFGLAAALAFALVKMMTSQPVSLEKTEPVAVAASPVTDRERMINDAINRKMNEQRNLPQPTSTDDDAPILMPRADKSAPVVLMPRSTQQPAAQKVASRTRPAAATDEEYDESSTPSGKASSGAKRTQILAPYERGNAEAALELAKKAGDKELADKLSKFIQLFDTANEAMVSGNGTLAITNFQKALTLDEGLSSGWGKYGSEIRRQLANLYTLVGLQYLSNGDDEKAKKAFEGALKQDPTNARAKQNLEKLSGSSAGASDDDEAAVAAPAPTGRRVITPAKKKPQSIDDAFGD